MKWLPLSLLCALALLSDGCEKHSASELVSDHGAGQAHPLPPEGTTSDHPDKTAREEKKADTDASGEAPKFFPEKK